MQAFKKRALPAAISLALGAGSLVPAAAHAGWYVGAGAGQSSLDEEIASEGQLAAAVDGLDPDTISFAADDSDTGWKVFGGYRFNHYFALEGQYADLGSVEVSSVTGTYDGGEGSFQGAGDVDVSGFGVNAVASLPLGDRFALFAKAGIFRWETEESGSLSTDLDGDFAASADDEGIDVNAGAGVRFTFMEHLGVQVEWENFKIDSDNVDLFSGSVTWEF
jgi:OOP family OmpA-OmpF porin